MDGLKIMPIPDYKAEYQDWSKECKQPVKLALESNNGKKIDVWADAKDLEAIGVYVGELK